MRAFEIQSPGKCGLIELPPPQPAAGEVLLRVQTVGFCGTDLSTFRGTNPLVSYPRVPGHEVAGTIEAVGAGVSDWAIGQQVLVFPYLECGSCTACRAARPNCCRHNQTLGVQRQGAMAELLAVPADKLIRGEGLSFSELALVEPLTVGAHAVARGEVRPADTVLVFGAGAIGLGVIAGAAYRGARVITVDLDDAKLQLARQCGAAETINARTQSLPDRVQELTYGDGAEVTVEAVGSPETFVAAVEHAAFAGRVVYLGYAKTTVEYETKLFVLKELDIRGSRNALRSDFAQVIQMLQQDRFPSSDVVSHNGTLDQAPDLINRWSETPQAFTKIQIQLPATGP